MHRHVVDSEEDSRKREERFVMMTQFPIRRLVLKMSVPTIVSMLITSFYNLVDTFFVGRLSTEATAGIGVSFAYMMFIQAFGFFFGHGSGNYISQALGAKNYRDAEKMAATGFFSPIIFGGLTGLLCLAFLTHVSRLLGATDEIIAYSNDYLRFILIGTPFMMSSLVLNNQLRLQGNARLAMIGITSGAILNIALDPLFIFGLDLGVTGASLATCVSQVCGWSILLVCTGLGGNVHIKIRNFSPSLKRYYQIMCGGLPSLCRQALACISTVFLNRAAAFYAEPGFEASTIAAFAVVTRFMMFAFAVILGIGQGFQPVCGFNWGAGLFKRVKEAYLFTFYAMTGFLVAIAAVSFILAPDIIRLFRSEDPELIRIGTRVLRWQCASFPFVGLSTSSGMLFQTTRMTVKATLLGMGRQGLFFIPIVFVAPLFLGLTGVEITQALADLLTFLMAIPFSINILHELDRRLL